MSVARYANPGSIAKNILIFIAFLFYLSGCAESGGGSGNGNGDARNIVGDNSNNVFEGIVIDIGDEWLYRKGTSSPPSDWISAGFDDSGWLTGNSGIGYGDDDDATILTDMLGNYATVYTRKVINYDGSINLNSLSLEIDYDDGFVAYINGQEVARANMPAGQPSFDTLASTYIEPGTPVFFNLDGFLNLIGIGDNVIAIEIHNASLDNSDLSFLPRLLVNMGGTPPLPPIVSLSANPTNVVANGSTTLNWSSTDATGCTASGDWSGSKATSGSQTINALTANSSFSLTCSGAGGSANDSVSVTVSPPSAPIVNLSTSPSSLPYNGSTTLSWSSSNTSGCTASGGWTGNKATSGSQTMSALISNSTFSLTCSGAGGSANDSVSVTVAAPPSGPIVNLSASPSSLPYNGSTTLSWSSNNTTSCTASGDWTGNKATSGSQTMSALTSNSNFSLACSGAGGSANDSVSVTVAAPPPTLSISASPVTVAQNGSTTLTWSTTDATNCTASGDWSGNKGAAGAETISSLMISSQFTLTCNGAGGSVNNTVNVTVVLNGNGTALLSWTPPTENTDGSPLTDLAGYKIRYGTSPGNYSNTETIGSGLSSYQVVNLTSSVWYFVITSFNSSDIESSYSTEVSKTIN